MSLPSERQTREFFRLWAEEKITFAGQSPGSHCRSFSESDEIINNAAGEIIAFSPPAF